MTGVDRDALALFLDAVTVAPAGPEIAGEVLAIGLMLLEKNMAYGNSALDPLRVFSKASPEEQILVRIDDKLSRLKRGQGLDGEDVVLDLIGYLVLLRLARKKARPEVSA